MVEKIIFGLRSASHMMSLCAFISLLSGGLCTVMEDKLLKDLGFGGDDGEYNKISRPVEFNNETVDVYLGIALRQIVQLDEVDEKLVVSVWERILWTDYRLKWNDSEYDGLKEIRIPPSKLWIPDIILYNSVREEVPNSGHTEDGDMFQVIVSHEGLCMYFPLGISSSQCEIAIGWFPFDDQFCNLEYQSWTYTDKELNMSFLPLRDEWITEADTTITKKNTQWDIIEAPGKRIEEPCDYKPDQPEIKCSSICFTIHLRRRVLFYIFNLILPCAVISTLTCVAFLLSSGERVGLGITTLLALSVYQIVVLDKIPASSEGIPLISKYFMAQFAITAVAIGMMVVTDRLHFRAESADKEYMMPHWVHIIIYTILARPLRMTPPSKHRTVAPKRSSPESNHRNHETSALHDHDNNDVVTAGKNGATTCSTYQEPENGRTVWEDEEEDEKEEEERVEMARKPFCSRRWKASAEEWTFAATVLDRACFYIFGVAQTILSIAIVIVPMAITRLTNLNVPSKE